MTSERRPSQSFPEPAALTKSVVVGVRVTASEHADLSARAAAMGVGIPEYLRRCADAVALIDQLQEAQR